MGRPPLRTTTVRPDATGTAKKVRVRKGGSLRSLLDIETTIIDKLRDDYGVTVQWVTDSVLGQPSPQSRNAFEVNAWEPVTPEMFDGIFDGMFMKKGHVGEINYEGLVLMWRPKELTDEAIAEDNMARYSALAAQQNMIKGGQLPGSFAAGFEPAHPTAVSRNVVERTIKPPMDIPRD